MVTGSLFIALGIILPLAFHFFNLGRAFLPMHIPVLLSGFFAGPILGLIVGFVTPLLSSLLTGMPPLMPPMAIGMAFELATYGFVSGWLYHNFKSNVYLALLVAMFSGRIVYGLIGAFFLPLIGLQSLAPTPLYPITLGIMSSLPGIALQLVFIPTIVLTVKKYLLIQSPLTN